MTQAEKYSWASLVTTAAIFWCFQMQMLDGFSLVEQDAGRLFGLYVTVTVLAIIAESIIAATLAVTERGRKVAKDERDRTIDAKANRNAFYFLCAVVNIMLIQILANAAFPGHVFPQIQLTTLSGMFFALFAALFSASIVKLISTIFYYRT